MAWGKGMAWEGVGRGGGGRGRGGGGRGVVWGGEGVGRGWPDGKGLGKGMAWKGGGLETGWPEGGRGSVECLARRMPGSSTGSGASLPGQPLTEPIMTPLAKCFWRKG